MSSNSMTRPSTSIWTTCAPGPPWLAKSKVNQVSLECYQSHVPPDLMALPEAKEVLVGVVDVASDVVETPELVAQTIAEARRYVPKEPCFNWRLAPMDRDIAVAKLEALAAGTGLARQRFT
jgi:5-methyltetrahydropteroyltriglutamate--homocysteine methyltransferase